MTDLLSRRLIPSPDAAESRVGDETVLLHRKSGLYFGLDAMGTRIWSMLKEGRNPTQICTEIACGHDVERATVEADVRAFLGDLDAHSLIVAEGDGGTP